MTALLPFEIKNVSEEDDRILKKYYKPDSGNEFLRVGPLGYLLPAGYRDHARDLYNMQVRPDDVWVASFPRSGTTWTQELVWLVRNNLDYDTARTVPILKRQTYLELSATYGDMVKMRDVSYVCDLPSPRFLKTHLPFSLLPPTLADAKVVYVARDVRDVAVSYFFLHKMLKRAHEEVQFKEFWKLFMKNLVNRTPIFSHIEEAWQKRAHPNVLFLFYEEMQKDLRGVIDRVCTFFGKEYTSVQKDALKEYLSFKNMKTIFDTSHQTDAGDSSMYPYLDDTFIRRGKSGGWVDYFDEDMTKEAEEYIQKHLQNSDLSFPVTG